MTKTYLFMVNSLAGPDALDYLVSRINQQITIPLDWHLWIGVPVFFAKEKVDTSFKELALAKLLSEVKILQEATHQYDTFPSYVQIVDAGDFSKTLYKWPSDQGILSE